MRDLAKDLEICEEYKAITNYDTYETRHAIAFATKAREGWPEAIKRAMEAEEEVKRTTELFNEALKGFITCQNNNAALTKENSKLSSQVAVLHKALINRIDSSADPDAALTELLKELAELEGGGR